MYAFFKNIVKISSNPSDYAPSSSTTCIDASKTVPTNSAKLVRTFSTNERHLKNEVYFQYSQNVPVCAEKYLVQLQMHFEMEKLKSQSEFSLISDPKTLVLEIKKQLEIENLGFDVKEIDKLLLILSKEKIDAEDALDSISEILEIIRPLDVESLRQSVKESIESSKIIANKDIILLLGVSGAGKSTTIQFLSGVKMHLVEIQGLRHIEAVDMDDPKMQSIKGSPGMKSETRSINAIEIDVENCGTDSQNKLIICDTPGFGDTEGAVIDIANGIGVANAMKCCASIRPVIVISSGSIGDRLQGLSEMSKILTKLFGNIADHLDAFTYFFTKFNKGDGQEIHSKIKHLKRKLSRADKTNTAFVAILDDMIKKTESGAVIVDPINDSPAQILDQTVLSTSPITNPAHVICNFVTPESVDILNRQLNQTDNSIRGALSRSEVQRVSYLMGQLKDMATQLKLQQCITSYDKCTVDVKNKIEEEMETLRATLRRVLDESNVNFSSDTDDIRLLKSTVSCLRDFDDIRIKHITDGVLPNLVNFASLLFDESARPQRNIFLENFQIKVFFNSSPEELFKFTKTFSTLAKLKFLSEIYTETKLPNLDSFQELVGDCFNVLSVQWKQACSDAELSVKQLNFSNYIGNMSFIQCVEGLNFERLLLDQNGVLEKRFKSLQGLMDQQISNSSSAAIDCIKVCLEYPDKLNTTMQLLVAFEKQHVPIELENFINVSCEKFHSDILAAACDMTKLLLTDITKIVQLSLDDRKVDYLKLQKDLIAVEALRNYESVKSIILDEYNNAIGKAKQSIESDSNIVSNAIKAILTKFPTSSCTNSFENLELADRCLKDFPLLYNNQFNELMEIFDKISVEVKIKVQDTSLLFDNQVDMRETLNISKRYLDVASSCKSNTKEFQSALFDRLKPELIKLKKLDIFKNISVSGNITLNRYLVHQICTYGTNCSVLMKITNGLNDTIKQIKDDIGTKFLLYFQTIKAQLDASDQQYTHSAIDTISTCLAELEDNVLFYNETTVTAPVGPQFGALYTKCLHQTSKEIYDDWCSPKGGRLVKMHTQLFKDKQVADKSGTIDAMVKVSKRLAPAVCLDRFLTKAEPKFENMNADIQSRLSRSLSDRKSQIVFKVQSTQYSEAAELFLDYQSTGDKEVLDEIADEVLITLCTQIKSLVSVSSLSVQSLEGAVKQIKFFDEVTKKLIPLMSKNHKVKDFTTSFAAFIENLYTKIDHHFSSHADLLRDKNFVRIEQSLQNADQFGSILNGISTVPTDDNEFNVPMSLSSFIDEKIRTTREKIDEILTSYESTIINVDFVDLTSDEYLTYLEKALEGLQTAATSNLSNRGNIYQACIDKMSDTVANTIATALTDPDILQQTDLAKEIFDALDIARKKLPATINAKYDKIFSDVRKKYKEIMEANEKEINDVSDFHVLVDSLVKYLGENNFNKAAMFRKTIRDKVSIAGKKIISTYNKDPRISLILNELMLSYEDWTYYIDSLARAAEKSGIKEPRNGYDYCKKTKKNAGGGGQIYDQNNNYNQYGNPDAQSQSYDSNAKKKKNSYDSQVHNSNSYMNSSVATVTSYLGNAFAYSKNMVSGTKQIELDSQQYRNTPNPNRQQQQPQQQQPQNQIIEQKNWEKDEMERQNNSFAYLYFDKNSELTKADCLRNFSDVALQSLNIFQSDIVGKKNLTRLCSDFEQLSTIADVGCVFTDFSKYLSEKGVNTLEIWDGISHVFVSSTSHFDSCLDNNDFSSLNQLLSTMKNCDPSIMQIKMYRPKFPQALQCSQYRQMKTALEKCKTYHMMKTVLSDKLNNWRDVLSESLINNEQLKSVNAYDRDEFYKSFSHALIALKKIQRCHIEEHTSGNTVNIHDVEMNAKLHISNEMSKMFSKLESLLPLIPTEDIDTYKKIAIWIDNFRSIAQNIEDVYIKEEAKTFTNDFRKHIDRRLKDIREEWSEAEKINADDDKLVENFIRIKPITIEIPDIKDAVDNLIDDFLRNIKKLSPQRIGVIGLKLDQHDNKSVTQMLINETKTLNGYSLLLRNQVTKKFTVDQVLQQLEVEGEAIDKIALKCQYDAFDTEYWNIVQSGLSDPEKVLAEIPDNARHISRDETLTFERKCRHLMAQICSYWTLENHNASGGRKLNEPIDNTSSMDPIDEKLSELLQPHAAQIISIFRILAIKSSNVGNLSYDTTASNSAGRLKKAHSFKMTSEMKREIKSIPKQLVQIFTGEGKSVTLAITACTLAILGCAVDCACYSEYLSKRDYIAFSSLFDAFHVKQYIEYGTFHRLCENFVNEKGNVREMVELNVLEKQSSLQSSSAVIRSRRPKVLLIDEVDVFFSKDFYGNLYKPFATVKDTTIECLIKYIWDNRNDRSAIKFNKLKDHGIYKTFLKRFVKYQSLVESCIKIALQDLHDFKSHAYIVSNDKVGYKDQDGVSFDIYYGYKTMFAYLNEADKKPPKISKEAALAKMMLTIDCGGFSYAEIPKLYDCVLGVTGTLKTLSPVEKNLLKTSYNIKIFSYIPSVYGNNKLDFVKDSIYGCIIDSKIGIHTIIRREIENRLNAVDGNLTYKRAVLVFFESTPKLISFYNSDQLKDIKDRLLILDEMTPSSSKEGIIRKAVINRY